MLNKDHALAIAQKLGADIKKKKNAHDLAMIFHDGRLVARFGIRRGSKKSLGHDHIPKELKVSPHVCMGLAQCSVTFADWLQAMRQQGRI